MYSNIFGWLKIFFLFTAFAALSCGGATDHLSDGPDDSFLGAGKADTNGIVEGSPAAIGVLKLANEGNLSVLKDSDKVGLDQRAADNIVAYRLGDDYAAGTGDDQVFDDLAELDAIPYVGPVAFGKLLAYAMSHGYVDLPPPPSPTRWNTIGTFTVPATLPSMMYSDGIFNPDWQKVRFLKISATCHLEYVARIKVQHWDGSKNIDKSTSLYQSESKEQIYQVGSGSSFEIIHNWLVELKWNGGPGSDCEVAVAVTSDLLGEEPVQNSSTIDFCGNQIDEDGDGKDRSCKDPQGTLPVVRTVTIYNRGANEGIRIDPQDEIIFPGGAPAHLRIINKSVWQVSFSGNLTGGYLNKAPDEITLSVGVPGKVIFKIPYEQVVLNLKAEWPAKPTAVETKLEGTFKAAGLPTMKVRLTMKPALGQQCIGASNMADSIDECASFTECTIAIQTKVELIDLATGGTITDYLFLTDQCNAYGDSYKSSFIWSSASNDVSIWSNWSNSTHSLNKKLLLSGPPDKLKGSLSGILNYSGDLAVSFVK